MSIADLSSRSFSPVTQSYTSRDTMLYALGLGVGHDPVDPLQLRFVYERQLLTLPTFAATLASPTAWMWDPATGIDADHVVALSHSLELFSEIPTSGVIRSEGRVTQVYDRGPDKGAVIHWERDLIDNESSKLLSRMHARALARNNGGFGGRPSPGRAVEHIPERNPDVRVEWATVESQALLYRLSGDLNRVHADPVAAHSAGFKRPILHGLCMLGIVGYTLVKVACDGDPSRLRRIATRYAGIAYPGQTLIIELWQEDAEWYFRCASRDDPRLVLDGGSATVA